MATKLILTRDNDGRWERRTVLVPRCPIVDFEGQNDTEEVRALKAQGFHQSGHVDGVVEDA